MYNIKRFALGGFCLISAVLFSESFVKEKLHKDKKVSLSRCQERTVMPLATLIRSTQEVATLGGDLVHMGNECVTVGNQLADRALILQKEALEATADLLDQEREGGVFASMTISQLDEYCQHLEKLVRALSLTQETILEKKHHYNEELNLLKKHVAGSLKECTW